VADEFTQYEILRSFAASWARAVLRQAKRYRTAHESAELKLWQYDRLEDWSPEWSQVMNAFDDAWTEGHMLVVAAHKLDAWTRRLATEARDRPVPVEDASLNALRDALEHLDEALFDDAGAPIPDRAKRKNWALDRLPKPPGSGISTKAGDLFALGLLSVQRLEQTAHELAGQIDDEIEAPAVDRFVQAEIDRRLGK
jgi:hypothetical protein